MGYRKKNVLLFFALVATPLAAEVYSNKTFIAAPVNALSFVDLKKVFKKNDVNWSFQAQGFYEQSTNAQALGANFLIDGSNALVINSGAVADKHLSSFIFINNNFIHDRSSNFAQALAGTITLEPLRQAMGVQFGYTQKLYKDFFLQVDLPVVSVTHNLRAKVSNETRLANIGVLDFFQGNYTGTASDNLQNPLTAAKFGGEQTVGGVAAINVILGAPLLKAEQAQAIISGHLSIPTGSRVKGEYLFEPLVGNGRHYEAGLFLDGMAQLYQAEKFEFNLHGAFGCMYVFSGLETRTVGFRNSNKVIKPLLPQYQLFGRINTTQALIPAANVLTMPLLITPGMRFDAAFDLCMAFKEFDIKAGYAIAARGCEDAVIQSWDDKIYSLANTVFNTSTNYNGSIFSTSASYPLLQSDLDTSNCTAPASHTHKLSASVFWYPIVNQYPGQFSFGGGYQFAQDNSSIALFDVFASVKFAF